MIDMEKQISYKNMEYLLKMQGYFVIRETNGVLNGEIKGLEVMYHGKTSAEQAKKLQEDLKEITHLVDVCCKGNNGEVYIKIKS